MVRDGPPRANYTSKLKTGPEPKNRPKLLKNFKLFRPSSGHLGLQSSTILYKGHVTRASPLDVNVHIVVPSSLAKIWGGFWKIWGGFWRYVPYYGIWALGGY